MATEASQYITCETQLAEKLSNITRFDGFNYYDDRESGLILHFKPCSAVNSLHASLISQLITTKIRAKKVIFDSIKECDSKIFCEFVKNYVPIFDILEIINMDFNAIIPITITEIKNKAQILIFKNISADGMRNIMEGVLNSCQRFLIVKLTIPSFFEFIAQFNRQIQQYASKKFSITILSLKLMELVNKGDLLYLKNVTLDGGIIPVHCIEEISDSNGAMENKIINSFLREKRFNSSSLTNFNSDKLFKFFSISALSNEQINKLLKNIKEVLHNWLHFLHNSQAH